MSEKPTQPASVEAPSSGYYSATFFVDQHSRFRGAAAAHPAFYIEPASSGYLTFQVESDLTAEEQLQVAERLVGAAAAWRDQLAERLEKARTAVDELAEAHAEIARLKSELAGGAA